jgi:hypothetical protein
MTKTASHDVLSREIERVIQEHFATSRRVLEIVLERAFGRAFHARVKQGAIEEGLSGGKRRRRGRAALMATAEQLFDAVRGQPGESITALAGALGLSAGELTRPMALLKASVRVRTVGQRHLTRYFPMADAPKTVTARHAATS